MTAMECDVRQQEMLPCGKCPNAAPLGKVKYCKVDGRIILPRSYNVCCCRGEKQKGIHNDSNQE